MSSCTSGERLRAFTLLELMAGMIASGIVITAIWTALHLVGGRAVANAGAGRAGEETSLFYRTFSTEFERAHRIVHEEEQIIFTDSLTGKTISYTFREDVVVRNDLVCTDTFAVTIRELRTTARGETENESPGRISFSIVHGQSTQEVFIQRRQTAVSIVRQHDRSFTTQR